MSDGREVPISDLTFEQFQEALKAPTAGLLYEKRNVSLFFPLLTLPQKLALNVYGWVAILMVPAGLALPFLLGSWWWLSLLPLAYITWQAQRRSLMQFFLENIQTDRAFYDAVRRTRGEVVRVVAKGGEA